MSKGFELQFSWIFVLIAGAIIMSFFFTLIKNQISDGEMGSARAAQQELSFIVRSSQASSTTQKSIPFNRPIEFSCTDTSQFRVKGSDISMRYDYQAIFAPKLLDGREILISTTPFRSPYKVSSVIYATNLDVDYVFVGNIPLMGSLFTLMPDNSSKRRINSLAANYPDNNYDEVVFVMTSQDFATSPVLSEVRDASFVVVDYDPLTSGVYGTVNFYDAQKNLIDSHPYFSDEMLLGAVISYDPESYWCNVRKIMQRTNLVTKLHKSRLEAIMGNVECDSYYANLNSELESIRVASDTWPISPVLMQSIYEDSNDLASINDQISRGTSCTPIY